MIEFRNIEFAYLDDKVFNDFSLTINEGEWVSLVGHNGSGKSTFSKLCCGLLKPSSGEIYIDNVLINDLEPNEISNVGVVFQNPDNQFVGSTVYDDVAFGLQNLAIKRDEILRRINHYVDVVGMSDFMYREPHTLSGGQKQRVAIASTLALHPSILILDEATSMLDPTGVKEVLSLVEELRKTLNLTIISITHDLDETLHADRIIVLNKGAIVLDDTASNVYQNEQLLIDCGLDIPFVVRLNNDLNYLNISKTLQLEEMVEELCNLNSKK